MIINANITSQVAADNLQQSQTMLTKSLARLSSGNKLTSPADDAAGSAVSSRLDAAVARIGAAQSNVANAVSFTQTQDGYLQKINTALNRMSELSMMARDGTKTDADRALYNFEFNQLASYVSDSGSKDFNGVSLFSSTPIDVTTDADGNTFTMAGIDMTAGSYLAATSSSIDTIANASAALNNVKAAIDQLATDRASAGAYQTRLTRSADQLTVVKENLSSASSRIRDVDVAEESTTYARFNILVQSGTAMLAQANQLPQSVLKLLQ